MLQEEAEDGHASTKTYAASTLALLSTAPQEEADGADGQPQKLSSPERQQAGEGTRSRAPRVSMADGAADGARSRAEAVAAAGAIPELVKLMRGECGLDAQKEAVRALYALADDEHNRRAIAEVLASPDRPLPTQRPLSRVTLSLQAPCSRAHAHPHSQRADDDVGSWRSVRVTLPLAGRRHRPADGSA